jgi:hypothetical protein
VVKNFILKIALLKKETESFVLEDVIMRGTPERMYIVGRGARLFFLTVTNLTNVEREHVVTSLAGIV